MGMFKNVVLGGLAFLAGAAFMANENEKQRHNNNSQQPWKRLPNDQGCNQSLSRFTQTIHKLMDDHGSLLSEETKQKLSCDLAKVKKEYDRYKSATAPSSKDATFHKPTTQQPSFQFPIYDSTPQNGPWVTHSPMDGAKKQIGVLEIYQDSLREMLDLIGLEYHKPDNGSSKNFMENEEIQALVKFTLNQIEKHFDLFQPDSKNPAPSQSTAATNAMPSTNSSEQTTTSNDKADTPQSSDADSIEHRDSSIISISGGSLGVNELLMDPIKKE